MGLFDFLGSLFGGGDSGGGMPTFDPGQFSLRGGDDFGGGDWMRGLRLADPGTFGADAEVPFRPDFIGGPRESLDDIARFSLGPGALGARGAGASDIALQGSGDELARVALAGGDGAGAGAPGDGTDWRKLLKTVGDVAGPVGRFGTLGLGIASNIQGAERAKKLQELQEKGFQLQEQSAEPLTKFGKDALARSEAGQVPPAVEKQIQLWKQGALTQVRDLYARMGMPVGTAEAAAERLVEEQAVAMRAKWLETQTGQGIDALKGAAGAAAGVGTSAGHERDSIDALIQQANAALSKMAGGGE